MHPILRLAIVAMVPWGLVITTWWLLA